LASEELADSVIQMAEAAEEAAGMAAVVVVEATLRTLAEAEAAAVPPMPWQI
jgi:hypothetical protein